MAANSPRLKSGFPVAITNNTPAAAIPPITCAMINDGSSDAGNRFPTAKPTETAGFRWYPEMWLMAYAIVTTVKPNARDTPRKPIPNWGKAPASTALPQPPKTGQNVPINSAHALFESDIWNLPELLCYVKCSGQNRIASSINHCVRR